MAPRLHQPVHFLLRHPREAPAALPGMLFIDDRSGMTEGVSCSLPAPGLGPTCGPATAACSPSLRSCSWCGACPTACCLDRTHLLCQCPAPIWAAGTAAVVPDVPAQLHKRFRLHPWVEGLRIPSEAQRPTDTTGIPQHLHTATASSAAAARVRRSAGGGGRRQEVGLAAAGAAGAPHARSYPPLDATRGRGRPVWAAGSARRGAALNSGLQGDAPCLRPAQATSIALSERSTRSRRA